MKCVLIFTVALASICARVGRADTIQWPGNGHWYEALWVPEGISWTAARDAAQARGGHLATIQSDQEDAFVYSLVFGDPRFWNSEWGPSQGPWLGGYQEANATEPTGGWRWVTGEPWTFSNFLSGEPNDYRGYDGNEWCLEYFYPTYMRGWNDLPNSGSHVRVLGYIVEYETTPVPLPATALAVLSLLGCISLFAVIKSRIALHGIAWPRQEWR